MRGLYAILDVATLATHGIDPLVFARAVLTARPCALQVRAKNVPARELLGLVRAVGPLCRAAGTMLIVNDRADLAALGGADGVHLGQEDLPVDLVRGLSPRLKIGLSTHTPEQLARALKYRPDYVAYGPVFPTKSKADPDAVVGLEGLQAAAAIVAASGYGTPLVAIGGIDLERAREVGELADAAAVIAGLVAGGAAEIAPRAKAFHVALGGTLPAPPLSAPALP